jgi:hypothetical protein
MSEMRKINGSKHRSFRSQMILSKFTTKDGLPNSTSLFLYRLILMSLVTSSTPSMRKLVCIQMLMGKLNTSKSACRETKIDKCNNMYHKKAMKVHLIPTNSYKNKLHIYPKKSNKKF